MRWCLLPLVAVLSAPCSAVVMNLRVARLRRDLEDRAGRMNSVGGVAQHDAALMEINFRKPGSVMTEQLVDRTYRRVLLVHARLGRRFLLWSRTAPPAAPPLWRERWFARATDRERADLLLGVAADVVLIKSYWTEMNRLASNQLDDDPMNRELEHVVNLLRDRVRIVLGRTSWAERAFDRRRLRALKRLSLDLDQDLLVRSCHRRLTTFIATEKGGE